MFLFNCTGKVAIIAIELIRIKKVARRMIGVRTLGRYNDI